MTDGGSSVPVTGLLVMMKPLSSEKIYAYTADEYIGPCLAFANSESNDEYDGCILLMLGARAPETTESTGVCEKLSTLVQGFWNAPSDPIHTSDA